jgi:hypothetical protein
MKEDPEHTFSYLRRREKPLLRESHKKERVFVIRRLLRVKQKLRITELDMTTKRQEKLIPLSI